MQSHGHRGTRTERELHCRWCCWTYNKKVFPLGFLKKKKKKKLYGARGRFLHAQMHWWRLFNDYAEPCRFLLFSTEWPAQQSSVAYAAAPKWTQARCHGSSWTDEMLKRKKERNENLILFTSRTRVVFLWGCVDSLWQQLKSLTSSFSP